MVLFVEQVEIENLVFNEVMYSNPPYGNNSLFRLECDVWNRAESIEIFFEVSSYNIYFQNICYEYITLYTSEGTISVQELWSLPVIYVLCCIRFWSLFSKDSVWTAHDLHVVSFYGSDDPVHHDKKQRKNILYLRVAPQRKLKILYLSIHWDQK